jgi:hypothetical protein
MTKVQESDLGMGGRKLFLKGGLRWIFFFFFFFFFFSTGA